MSTHDDFRRAVTDTLLVLAARRWDANKVVREDFPDYASFLFFKRASQPRDSYEDTLRNDPCAFCGDRPAGTVDHITPKSLGGKNGWRNLTGACEECNRQKSSASVLLYLWVRHGGDRSVLEWRVRPPKPPRHKRPETPPVPPMMTPLGCLVWNRSISRDQSLHSDREGVS